MDDNKKTLLISKLVKTIQSENKNQYEAFFKKHHKADIAEIIHELKEPLQETFFKKVNLKQVVKVFEELTIEKQVSLALKIETPLAAKIVKEMHTNDAGDLLEELQETDKNKANSIIKLLPKQEAEDLQELLSYPDNSAGTLMTTEYLSIPENLNVKQALTHIRKQDPPESEISFYIFVVNKKETLIGYVTLRTLLMSNPGESIKNIRNDYPIKATVNTDQEEVAKIFQKYNVVALPIVNNNDQLVGLITVDDIVDVVIEEATEDIYKLSGTSEIEESKLLSGKLHHSISSRTPWLIITIFGGIVASFLITKYSSVFTTTHFSLALSLSFVPLLMGLGGNVGNQSATIIVRGLSTGYIQKKHPMHHIFREVTIGLLIGLLIGSILFLVNYYILHLSFLFSSIVTFSLICNITAAAFLGSSLPLIFQRIKIDPAVASAPFISTALDIIGQLIYFTVTLKIIHYLA